MGKLFRNLTAGAALVFLVGIVRFAAMIPVSEVRATVGQTATPILPAPTIVPVVPIPPTITPAAMVARTATRSGHADDAAWLTIVPGAVLPDGSIGVGLDMLEVRAHGVSGAVRVTFYMQLVGMDATILGEDTDLGDGASVPWLNLSATTEAQIWAIAHGPTGSRVLLRSITARYTPADPATPARGSTHRAD